MNTRKQKAALAIGLVLLLAGCTALMPGGDETSVGLDYAPDESVALIEVDPAIVEDEETLQVLEATAPDEESVEDEIQDELAEAELDYDELHSVVAFAQPNPDADEFESQEDAAVILDSDWDEEEFVDLAGEDASYEFVEQEHAGHTMYAPDEEPEFGGAEYIGVIDDGVFVVGDQAAVESSLEVAADERDAVGGDLLDTYEDIRDDALISVAVEFDEELVEGTPAAQDPQQADLVDSLETGSVAYYSDSGNLGMEAQAHVDNEADAEDLNDMLSGWLVTYEQALGEENEDLANQLDDVNVEQDGTTITVTWEGDVDTLVEILEEERV